MNTKVKKDIKKEWKEKNFGKGDAVSIIRYKKISSMIKSGSSVLDIGCANKNLKPFVNGLYVGIDVDGKPDIKGSCYRLPFKDGSFDYIVMSEVIEHLEKPFDAILEAKRVAKKIIITTPNPYAFAKLVGYVTGLVDKEPLTHYISYNEHNLRNIFRACGLKVNYYCKWGFKIPKWKFLPIKSKFGGFHIFVVSKK